MSRKILKIANRNISDQNPPFIIAEIGQTHNGSIEKAFKFIDKVKMNGGDAVKFQLHIASSPWILVRCQDYLCSLYDDPSHPSKAFLQRPFCSFFRRFFAVSKYRLLALVILPQL